LELEIVDWSTHQRVGTDGLLEFHTYGLKLIARRVVFLGCELSFFEGYWFIETPFAVGEAEIEWWDDHKEYKISVYIGADPQKIDERHRWEQMLSEIAHWQGALIGKTGVRLGSVFFGNGYNVLCVEAVHALIIRLCTCLERIEDWLPNVLIDDSINLQVALPNQIAHEQFAPVVQQWLASSEHPPLFRDVSNQVDMSEHSSVQQVQFWIQQVISVIESTIDSLKGPAVHSWRNQRSRSLEMLRERLNFLRLRPPLYPSIYQHNVMPTVESNFFNPTMSEMGRLVYQITSPNFSINKGDFPVSGRHSFGIYEIWCFHQLIERCTSLLQTQPQFAEGQCLEWGGEVQWDSQYGLVTLHYNLRFIPYWERRSESKAPFSLVGEQRPDFVLQVDNRWLVLDAKYRSTRVNVLDAFSSAFSYLSSLRMPLLHIEPEGCFLLVPKLLRESRHWFEADFHRDYKFGLLCCGPNDYKDVETNLIWFLFGQSKS